MSNEVLAAKLDTLTDEVRELRRELVRRDVYDAQRDADLARIKALESRQADAGNTRKQTMFALLGAGLALAVSILRPLFG